MLPETLVVYLLRRIAPEICLEAVYLVGVLVVSSVWGLALGVVTAVLSAAAFGFFCVAPALHLVRALTLSAAAIELEAVAGEERRAAFALRDGGTLLVPADLPQTTQRLVRERVGGVGRGAFGCGARW